MGFTFSTQKVFPPIQILDLYASVEWTAYTKDIPKLLRALEKSSLVISAWEGEELLGLSRTITDGETIAYIQDILVKPEFQGKNIGSKLMSLMLEELEGIRQIVLMTDTGEPNNHLHAWYESHGFQAYDQLGVTGFAIFNFT